MVSTSVRLFRAPVPEDPDEAGLVVLPDLNVVVLLLLLPPPPAEQAPTNHIDNATPINVSNQNFIGSPLAARILTT